MNYGNMLVDYENVVMSVLSHGHRRGDRTGTGIISAFGYHMVHDHRLHGFPLLGLKSTNFKAVMAELFWFIKGSTNTRDLDSKIWDEWADEDGECGPIYGKQWRSWSTYNRPWAECDGVTSVDQLQQCIDGLRSNPHGRRHLVSAWNPTEIPQMALPPCHFAFQFYVEGDESLSIRVHQRSADLMLGVPFNMASYSLLLMLVAQCVGRKPGRHIHDLGDTHIYTNHESAAKEMIRRHRPINPRVSLDTDITNINCFLPRHVKVEGYNPQPAMKLPVAV